MLLHCQPLLQAQLPQTEATLAQLVLQLLDLPLLQKDLAALQQREQLVGLLQQLWLALQLVLAYLLQLHLAAAP